MYCQILTNNEQRCQFLTKHTHLFKKAYLKKKETLAASLKRSKHGLGTPEHTFSKKVRLNTTKKVPAASLKRSKHGLGLPRHKKCYLYWLVFISISYWYYQYQLYWFPIPYCLCPIGAPGAAGPSVRGAGGAVRRGPLREGPAHGAGPGPGPGPGPAHQ